MKDIFELTREIINKYRDAQEEMELINNKLINMNHKIELESCNSDAEKVERYDRLVRLLEDRRRCKDFLSMIPRIYGDIDLLENKLLGQVHFYENRTFTPRSEEE